MPISEEVKVKLNRVLDMYDIDDNLRKFYYSKELEEEYTIEDYKFYSIRNIIDAYSEANKENISKQFEICYMMIGMGHECVLVYEPRVKKYMFRHGGGSSGMDSYEIMKYFETKFEPTRQEFCKYLFDFHTAINKIQNQETYSYMIMDS